MGKIGPCTETLAILTFISMQEANIFNWLKYYFIGTPCSYTEYYYNIIE